MPASRVPRNVGTDLLSETMEREYYARWCAIRQKKSNHLAHYNGASGLQLSDTDFTLGFRVYQNKDV